MQTDFQSYSDHSDTISYSFHHLTEVLKQNKYQKLLHQNPYVVKSVLEERYLA